MKLAFALGFVVAFAASGCGKKNEDKPATEPAPAPATVDLRVQVDHPDTNLDAAAFSLVGGGAPITASSAERSGASGKGAAVVVAIQGDLRWMGTETYDKNEDDVIVGAFAGLPAALDGLAAELPKGSQVAVLTFGGSAPKVRYPMGEVAGLKGSVLGAQRDYDEVGVPLVATVSEAQRLLAAASADRRVLLLLGNGDDLNEEGVVAALEPALKSLESLNADVITVYYTTVPREDDKGTKVLEALGYTQALTVDARDQFAGVARAVAQRIGNRYTVTFDVGADIAKNPAALSVKVGAETKPVQPAPAVVAFGGYAETAPAAPPADGEGDGDDSGDGDADDE